MSLRLVRNHTLKAPARGPLTRVAQTTHRHSQSIRCFHLHSNLGDSTTNDLVAEQYSPSNFGYRVVPAFNGARYTCTEPALASFEEPCTVQRGTVNTLGNIFGAVSADPPEEVMASQAEWDCLLEEEERTKSMDRELLYPAGKMEGVDQAAPDFSVSEDAQKPEEVDESCFYDVDY